MFIAIMLPFLMVGGTSWHHEGSSLDPFDESKRDTLCQINYVYDHKMQQLCLANNLMQVYMFRTSNSSPLGLSQDSFFQFLNIALI